MGFQYSISAIVSVSVRSSISLLGFCLEVEQMFSVELTVKHFMCSCMEALRQLADQTHLYLLQLILLLEAMKVQGSYGRAMRWRRAFESGEVCLSGRIRFCNRRRGRAWVKVQGKKFWVVWCHLGEVACFFSSSQALEQSFKGMEALIPAPKNW